MATFNSAGSGNANDDATWTESGQPASGDHCIIASGHTVTLTADELWGSARVIGTIAGGGHTLTLDSTSDDNIFRWDGTISGNLDITITGGNNKNIKDNSGTGDIRNLTINNSGNTINTGDGTSLTIAGNLTVTAGTLSTTGSNLDLTVTGHVSVDGTLTGNASAISVGSMIINSGGTYSATSGTTTVTSENASHAFRCSGGGTFTNNDGTLEIQTAAQTRLKMNGTGNVHNLTVNHASCQLHMESDSSTTVEGDLTITAGIVNTNTEGGASRNLTVAGNTVVTGTLTGNDSTLVFGTDGVSGSTEAGALHVESSGSLTFGSGDLTAFSGFTAKGTNTVTSTGGGDILIKGRTNNGFMNSHGHTGVNITGDYKILYDNNSLHDVRNNMAITAANIIYSVSNRTYDFWTTSTDSTVTFTGNLQISNSTTTLNTQETGREPTQTFTVSGDTTLDGTLIGNSTEISLGSLKIANGGTYTATSGTTTLTNKNSSNYMLEDLGTFTHNNGTVHFKADTSSGTWYAVKGHSTEDTTEFYNVTTERVGSSIGNYRVCVGGSNQFFTVRNNLTVAANCKIFSSNGSSILRHSGLAIIDGELDLDSFTDIEMGAVTINSGGTLEFDNGSITLKAESFRNVGGTINA